MEGTQELGRLSHPHVQPRLSPLGSYLPPLICRECGHAALFPQVSVVQRAVGGTGCSRELDAGSTQAQFGEPLTTQPHRASVSQLYNRTITPPSRNPWCKPLNNHRP